MMKKNTIKALTLSAGLLASLSSAEAANVILNGEFDAGLSGFSSSYAIGGDAYAPGVVNVGSNPNALHSGWASFGAFSGENMLIVNGGESLASNVVWSQTIHLTAGTSYDFTAAAASVYSGNPSKLQAVLTVGAVDHVLGTVQLGAAGEWQSWGGSVVSPFSGSAQLKLLNLSTDYNGNDFAIDYLSLTSAVPEPQSLALMLAGLGAMGFVARRRQRG
ncbi:PEP-CTERM sorting domain-containing protein [Roseateles violae]|uniref:PEP-CTERM sorting domain-containing protein n=1 Tax=Roseateles violae TaxID=3058042 RepID=A0ABT8DW00_9BURK|nr:PEP-CTERM sorting domain-containing protein [Pelomonas sp. PFR6]MDN3922481.1 PEP-CTERM sorting domain-containing protein [Pelomonas sp. PFR6]